MPAGRPKKKRNVSETIKSNYIKAAKQLAKEYGYTLEYAMLNMIYDKTIQDTVKASIMKSYNEAMIVKESQKEIKVTDTRPPSVYLPDMDGDPALKLVEGGKK